jgi:hypothetical protein
VNRLLGYSLGTDVNAPASGRREGLCARRACDLRKRRYRKDLAATSPRIRRAFVWRCCGWARRDTRSGLVGRVDVVPGGEATVVFLRPAGVWRDLWRSYGLYLDGRACGKVRPGHEVRVVVRPGRHVAQARIDWTGSPKVTFDVGAGQVVQLCVAAARTFDIRLGFGMTSYLELSVVRQAGELGS